MLRRPEQGGWLELHLRPRRQGESHPLADAMVDLFTDPDAVEGAFAAFLYARRMLGPRVEAWVVDIGSAPCDWPAAARGVTGDSFSLALLFQLVARCQDAIWPDGVFVTGAVRAASVAWRWDRRWPRVAGWRCTATGGCCCPGAIMDNWDGRASTVIAAWPCPPILRSASRYGSVA